MFWERVTCIMYLIKVLLSLDHFKTCHDNAMFKMAIGQIYLKKVEMLFAQNFVQVSIMHQKFW